MLEICTGFSHLKKNEYCMLPFSVLSLRNNTGYRLQISIIHTVKKEIAQFLEVFPPETHTFSQTQFGNSSLAVVTCKLTEYSI